MCERTQYVSQVFGVELKLIPLISFPEDNFFLSGESVSLLWKFVCFWTIPMHGLILAHTTLVSLKLLVNNILFVLVSVQTSVSPPMFLSPGCTSHQSWLYLTSVLTSSSISPPYSSCFSSSPTTQWHNKPPFHDCDKPA